MTMPQPLAPPPAAAPQEQSPDTAPMPPTWWRRNRIAVFALPLALLVTFAAAGDRLVDYWWTSDLRVEDARVPAGEAAVLTGVPPYFDLLEEDALVSEEEPVSIGVALVDIDRLAVLDDGFSESPLPDDTNAYEVTLGFEAPQPVETYCTLMIVGSDGARYGEAYDPLSQRPACTALDETGSAVEGPEGEWTNSFTVLTAAGAELDVVRVTYDGVHYVTLELPEGF